MESIDEMTPDQLRAMADEMEGSGQRPGYMRRVEVDGIMVDVDMRVIADIRTMRIIADVQGKDDSESAFAAIRLFDRILGDQREAVEAALSDADGFCPVERYVSFSMRLFEAVGAKKLTLLARVWVEHPDELRADFQQYYGLNLDGMGRDYTTLHAASLLTQLPEGSRVRLAYAPDAAWTSERSLLAAIVNDLNWLVWAQTKDAKHNRNRPKPIGPSRDNPNQKRVVGVAMTPDRLMAEMARIRREAQRG